MCLGPSIIHTYPRSIIQSYTYWEGLFQRCIGGFPQMHRALLDRTSSQSLAIQPYITHTHTHVRHHVNIYILRWLRKKGIGLFFKVYRALLVRRCFESFAKRETKLGKRAGYDRIYSLMNAASSTHIHIQRLPLIRHVTGASWFKSIYNSLGSRVFWEHRSRVLYYTNMWMGLDVLCIHMLIATLFSSMGAELSKHV